VEYFKILAMSGVNIQNAMISEDIWKDYPYPNPVFIE